MKKKLKKQLLAVGMTSFAQSIAGQLAKSLIPPSGSCPMSQERYNALREEYNAAVEEYSKGEVCSSQVEIDEYLALLESIRTANKILFSNGFTTDSCTKNSHPEILEVLRNAATDELRRIIVKIQGEHLAAIIKDDGSFQSLWERENDLE